MSPWKPLFSIVVAIWPRWLLSWIHCVMKVDNAAQMTFITQWIQDSNHLGQMATTIENNGFQGDIAGLVQQIQTFENNANAFDQSQGGLWSARFWNEFRVDGTTGVAAKALIKGLQTQNA